MVGRAGQQNNGPTTTKLLRLIWGSKTDLLTKFHPNQTILAKVIHLFRFLAGRLVGPVCSIKLKKNNTIHCVFIGYSCIQKIKPKSQSIKKLFHFCCNPPTPMAVYRLSRKDETANNPIFSLLNTILSSTSCLGRNFCFHSLLICKTNAKFMLLVQYWDEIKKYTPLL